MPAQPMALCLHNTASWEGFSRLPSSESVECFLPDQRRGKLVNHTPNAAVAHRLPRTVVCTLPAKCRCNLLLQAQLSIIPGIKLQDSAKRPLQASPGDSKQKNCSRSDTPRLHLLAQSCLGPVAQGGAHSRYPAQFGNLMLQKHG